MHANCLHMKRLCTRVNIKSLLLPSFVYELESSRIFRIYMNFSFAIQKPNFSFTSLSFHVVRSFVPFKFSSSTFLEMSFKCSTIRVCVSAYARIYYDVRKSSLFYFTSNHARQPNGNIYCGLWTTIAHISHMKQSMAAIAAAQRTVPIRMVLRLISKRVFNDSNENYEHLVAWKTKLHYY